MSTFHDVKFLPLKNYEKFENLCLEMWQKKIPTVQKNGRKGQKQDGVDIFGFIEDNNDLHWIGIQCKVKAAGSTLTKREVEEEIEKAKSFSPELAEYIIITTSSRDARLQKYVREMNEKFIKKELFQIRIFFWDDIELLLGEEINLSFAP